MKNALKISAVLVAWLGVAGCAGIVEIRLPREFKGKKMIEDPPLSMILPAHDGEAAG